VNQLSSDLIIIIIVNITHHFSTPNGTVRNTKHKDKSQTKRVK